MGRNKPCRDRMPCGPLLNGRVHLSFDEQKLGSVEVGKLADLVVLSGDYLMCPEATIGSLKVERTIVGGKTVDTSPGSLRMSSRQPHEV